MPQERGAPPDPGAGAVTSLAGPGRGCRRVPTGLLGFLDQLYPSVTYQTIFEADNVYVFRRTANGPRRS